MTNDPLSERFDTRLNLNARPSLQELSATSFPFEVAAIDYDFASRQNSFHYTLNLLAFVGTVVAVHVTCLETESLFFFAIKDHDVRVRSNCDGSFLRKEAEH